MTIVLSLSLTLVVLASCAMPEPSARISLHDTSWIQPGVTTRQDVVTHFGEPVSAIQFQDSETVRYGRPPKLTQPPSVPSVVATPRGYATVTPSIAPDTNELQERPLWIRYNKQGVVTAFGFDDPPPR